MSRKTTVLLIIPMFVARKLFSIKAFLSRFLN
jgi:hypothetical protein